MRRIALIAAFGLLLLGLVVLTPLPLAPRRELTNGGVTDRDLPSVRFPPLSPAGVLSLQRGLGRQVLRCRQRLDRVAGTPDPLPSEGADSLEGQSGWADPLGQWQRNDQNAIAIGDGCQLTINARREIELTVAGPDVPLLEHHFFIVPERPT